jgi:hypothetical protein
MRWMLPGTLCGILACSGEITTSNDEETETLRELQPVQRDGPPMAEEIDGECVYRPGTYRVRYAFDPPSASCEEFVPWTDETLTLSTDISLASIDYSPPDGSCGTGNLIVDGCRISFDRYCDLQPENRQVVMFGVFEYDFSTSRGHGSLDVSTFDTTRDPPRLLEKCRPNVITTLQRR